MKQDIFDLEYFKVQRKEVGGCHDDGQNLVALFVAANVYIQQWYFIDLNKDRLDNHGA